MKIYNFLLWSHKIRQERLYINNRGHFGNLDIGSIKIDSIEAYKYFNNIRFLQLNKIDIKIVI